MNIAIDFDETISLDPKHWLQIILLMKSFDWNVFVVTFRQSNCDPHDLDFLRPHVNRVIFTGQVAKLPFLESMNIQIDVWIDDTPESITHNYSLTKGFFQPEN